MLLRRSFYYAQFPLAVILPTWVLVSRGIVADGVGWQLVVYLLVCPILFAALVATVGLVVARKSVRQAKAVSWLDVGLLVALAVALFAYGLFAFPLLAALVVILVLGWFWAALWQLFDETRSRVKGFLDAGPRSSADVIVVPPERLSR